MTAPTRAQLAEEFGITVELIDMAEVIKRDGVPELAEAIMAGKLDIHDAHHALAFPPGQQRQIASSGALPACDIWLGDQGRYCGSRDRTRRYLPGYRCPEHAPAALRAVAR